MSKVTLLKEVVRDSLPVADATVATGWLPGQAFQYDSTGNYGEIASADGALFVGMDDDLELASPPTGSLVTVLYGAGTTILVDHAAEVAASSSDRCYDTVSGNPESGAYNQNLYLNGVGKWTTTATGSVKGKLTEIPSSANSYTIGVITRF